jgi:hypothetical protein
MQFSINFWRSLFCLTSDSSEDVEATLDKTWQQGETEQEAEKKDSPQVGFSAYLFSLIIY